MHSLEQVKYDDQVILTTEQLAEFYGTSTRAIAQNFKNNESKFQEGKHYFLLRGENLKKFRLQFENFESQISPMTRVLYLWTKRGASRHAKMLGTDRAWDVYDELEETYFNHQSELRMPETPLEIMSVVGKITERQDKRLKELNTKVTYLTDLAGLTSSRNKELTKARNKRVIERCGGAGSNAYKDVVLRKKVYHQMFQDYKECFDVNQYIDTPMKRFDEAKNFITNWHERYPLEQEIKRANEQTSLAI
ncbi:ORF6C domain-containing protein [Ligilactobacillus animalis]|uniref:ORF6C domain-containing protein n=1 Tax=Ligilactobacillus animalis TaxID=1605 RepID=UPI0026E05DF8|nr:ORF6C domain-containing protein [Ligilactobacillus animalis]MDO5884169.1 ORF6C domain-containing protein [Ligilactobacillus animalis]